MSKPRMIMIYGESGGTKTSQVYHLIKYIYKKYGLKTRLIGTNASDSSPFEDSGMIEKGIVDFFDISNRELALADVRRLSTGYWPRKIKGSNEVYFKTDDKCLTTAEQWKDIGCYAIEGITGLSSLFLNHIRQQEEGVGFKHSFKYEEDGYVIGGLQEGHYGLVQQEIYKILVQGFACLPVKFVIVTGLVGKGEDKQKRETVYGPKSAGQASTFEIPSWFMDCFHLDIVKLKKRDSDDVIEQRVAWYRRHNDKDTDIPYLAKVRSLPELYPKIEQKWRHGFIPLGFEDGLNKFYEFYLDEVVASSQATMQQQ